MVPQPVRRWLALRTSLTAALAARFGDEVRVCVLSERRARFLPSERAALRTAARVGRIREVRLQIGAIGYVVARTAFPESTARAANRRLLRLGNRALGSLLFGSMRAPAATREFASLCPSSSLWQALRTHLPRTAAQLWARRAVHLFRGRPLVVTEIFLAEMWTNDS